MQRNSIQFSQSRIYRYAFVIVIVILTTFTLNYGFKKSKTIRSLIAGLYFDPKYYLKEYPDLKDSILASNPFKHYILHGWEEGRIPSKFIKNLLKFYYGLYFDKEYYSSHYPDVRHWSSPLEQYIKHGRYTNRHPNKISEIITKIKWKLTSKKVIPLKNAKYYLSIATMFQNEAKFLKEWIEFYRLMGVEHFYLYDHLSTDNCKEVLQPYIDRGLVELTHITETPKNRIDFFRLQTQVHNDILKQTKGETEWLIVVDTDEFLFPVQEEDLKTVLKRYDSYASLSVNWRLFGTNDKEKLGDDELLIENLTECSFANDLHVKNIVKPRYADKFIDNTHFARLKPGYYQVTENFEPFYGPFSPTQSLNVLRINHYWTRDWEFFKERKLKRQHIIGKLGDIAALNENTSTQYKELLNKFVDDLSKQCFPTVDLNITPRYDNSIFKFVPQLKNIIFPTTNSTKYIIDK